MIINPVDDIKDLFIVENIYSDELINQIQSTNLLSYSHTTVSWQEHVPRKLLIFDYSDILAQLNKELQSKISIISEYINVDIKNVSTNIWIDEGQLEGKMNIHVDNPGVGVAMQIYLLPNDVNLGTKFYYDCSPDWLSGTLRYDFPFKVNSGYIMINGPKQYHGPPKIIPNGTIRCSSYSLFT